MACERFDKLQRRDFSIQKISLKGSIRPWAVASADLTPPLSLSLFQLSTSFSPSEAQGESQFHISGLDFLLASIRTRSLLYSIFKWQAAAFPLVLVAQMTTVPVFVKGKVSLTLQKDCNLVIFYDVSKIWATDINASF